MPALDVQICTSALLMTGADGIQSFEDEGSREAELCAQFYPNTLDALLQDHTWRFSLKEQELNLLANVTPEYGYTYAHQMPSDFIRLVSTDENSDNFTIVGEYMYTNRKQVKITYQFRPDESLFSPLFREVLELRLAGRLSIGLLGDLGMADMFDKRADKMLRKARVVDSQDIATPNLSENNFLLTAVRY